MPFTLTSIVPWGRSFGEYQRMFALSEADLGRTILGCADGPASFNAEATRRGMRVASCDPMYRFSGDEIRGRVEAVYSEMMEQTRRNASEFIWKEFASAEALGEARMGAMRLFLDDYEAGTRAGRYVAAESPTLPFAHASFDLALCSHFLFLYTEQLSEAFHLATIRDLCRVAREVRIFPLVAVGSGRSRYVETIVPTLRADGYRVDIERVPYEFKRGANEMMRAGRSQR